MSIKTVVNNIFQVTLNVIIYSLFTSAQAQVVPDATLPNNSIVTSEHENIIITGGTKTGANLFHSFSQFSVRTGENVYFDNTPKVDNIIMRVTGRNISNIDGLIRTAGNINLYLFNPNGIHFGKNATLDIKGSLYLSTAQSWKFPDSDKSADTTPLLRVSAPIGIQWGSETGNIQLDTNLSSRDVTLTANNITITANLTSTGDINLVAKSINFDGAVIKSIQAGNINLQADSVFIANGSKLINNNTVDRNGGDITVEASNIFTITGAKTGLFVDTTPGSATNGGNIYIKAPNVQIKDEARVTVSSQGSGKSGNLQLVSNNLTIKGGTLSAKTPTEGGNLNVYAYGLLVLRDNATISTISEGKGNGANINVQAGFILVNPNGNNDITTNVVQNNVGKIRISSNAIFGLEIRSLPTASSDIIVTSPANNHDNININTLNIDPNRGVTVLPTSIVDVSKQINQTCSNQATANRFIIIGRGGLPLNTTEALNLNSGWIDWRRVDEVENNKETVVSTQHQLIEATGWEVENGQIKLVASHKASPSTLIMCNDG